MENAIQVVNGETQVMQRPPTEVLQEARKAATALTDVISTKKKRVVFNGEQYLEFEDWQTLGKFYGLTAKVISTNQVEIGDTVGFEAKAEVIRVSDGMVVSAADAMCLKDEPNWAKKPLFQLKSMAQTRACAKALRNVLAWVAVLAGYKPTPAEEIEPQIAEAQEPFPPKEYLAEVPDDNLASWVMPGGKYKGMTLSQVLGDTSENGKARGREYLEWCISEEATKINPNTKETIERFLQQMDII